MFYPRIDAGRCIECGKCVTVCPSADVDGMPTEGKRTFVKDPPIASYAAFAKDFETRWNSTSGGVICAIVKKLLSEGTYRRAYVVSYDRFDGIQAELKSIDAAAKMDAAAKSKYIPVSVAAIVGDIRNGGISGSIVVCTPCQLKAIRAALAQCGEPEDDILFVGLFCERMFNYNIYGYYEKEYGAFDKLYFREKEPDGWPGHTTIVKDGVRTKIDRKVRMSLKKVYPVKRCDYCSDKLNVDADISVGDCYVKGFGTPDGRGGVSSVVVRTEKGNRALFLCKDVLEMRGLDYDLIRLAQSTVPASECDPRVYNVLIDVASLDNRGDWLMFESVLEQVRGRLPRAVVYVSQGAYLKTPKYFADRKILPLIDPASIDLMLFAPGFRFSDQFGVPSEEIARKQARYYGEFNKPGRKMVFLPQAFGPFESKISALRVKLSTAPADLVFAREKTSHDYLASKIDRLERLSIAPDFTCLYHPEECKTPYPRGSYVVVVPNMRMIDRSDESTAARYREFSVKLLKALLARGESIVLLNHEGPGDTVLLTEFNAATGGSCKIVDNVSAGTCKSIISGAKLVVTSRFHGFVSALSEGVPTFCTSWSHKYKELAEEFGCPGSCLSLSDVDAAVGTAMDGLVHPDACRASAKAIATVRKRVQDMWDKVFALIPDWAAKSKPLNGKVLDALGGVLSAGSVAEKIKLQESQRSRGELFKKLQESQKSRVKLWGEKQAAEKAKADLWARLQESESARGTLWGEKQAAEKAKADLWARLQESERARGTLWGEKQAAEKAKAELRARLRELEKAKAKIWQERCALTASVNSLQMTFAEINKTIEE